MKILCEHVASVRKISAPKGSKGFWSSRPGTSYFGGSMKAFPGNSSVPIWQQRLYLNLSEFIERKICQKWDTALHFLHFLHVQMRRTSVRFSPRLHGFSHQEGFLKRTSSGGFRRPPISDVLTKHKEKEIVPDSFLFQINSFFKCENLF